MSTLNRNQVETAAAELYEAEKNRVQISPVTQTFPSMDMDDAYAIQSAWVEKKVEQPVSKDYLYDLLHRHGWRKVVPRPQHPQADRKKQAAFKKNFPSWWEPPPKVSLPETHAP